MDNMGDAENNRSSSSDDTAENYINLQKLYARLLAKYPHLVSLLSLCIGALSALVFKFYGFPDFSDPTAGFEARGTDISGALRTMRLLHYYDTPYSLMPNITLLQQTFNLTPSPLDTGASSINRRKRDTGSSYSITESCAARSFDANKRIKLVFESSTGDDLYTAEAMQGICEMENQYVTNQLEMTCPMHSLPFYIATLQNKLCMELHESDMHEFRDRLDLCAPYYFNNTLTEECGSGSNCPNVPDQCKTYNAIYKILHIMADVNFYPNRTDTSGNVLKSLTHNPLTYTMMIFSGDPPDMTVLDYYKKVFDHKHPDNGVVKIVGFHSTTHDKFDLFNELMMSDMWYFILAGVLILLMLWAYLRSFCLMIATFFNVALSGAAAYFIYFVVLRITFFPFMNMLAILILIAVSADDVFIFYDTWLQVRASSKGKPSAIQVEKTFEHAALSIMVTSFTTSAAFFCNFVSQITAIRCFCLFTGLAVLANFIVMITWTPGIIILFDIIWNWLVRRMNCCKFTVGTFGKITKCIHRIFNNLERIPKFVYGKMFPWLIEKLWFVWIIIALVGGLLGAIAVFWKPGLQLPKSLEFQLFPTTSLMENFDQHLSEKFSFQDIQYKIHVSFIWGFTGEDVGDKLDPDDDGRITVDKTFNFTDPEVQMWLLKFCRDARQQEFIESRFTGATYKCFLEAYEMSLQKFCKPDSLIVTAVAACCQNTTPPYPSALFEKCSPLIYLDPDLNSLKIHPVDTVIFDKENKPVAYAIRIKARQSFSTSFEIVDNLYKTIDNYFHDQLAQAPKGASQAFLTGTFQFYDLQRAIGSGTFYSIPLSLAVAFAMMFLTSLNLLITFWALVTILLAIAATIGCIVMMGWPLGILESVTISLAVGLSIDFTIHYGVAYRLSKEKTQVKRVNESFIRVGSAVAMAALTTFTAGASVMPSSILAYSKLGTFLMLVMSFSWWYATFFFMSVCRIIGPRTTFCQIRLPCCREQDVPDINLDPSTDAVIDDNFLNDHQVSGANSNATSMSVLTSIV